MMCAICGGELDARERRCAACDAARGTGALPGLDLELDLTPAQRAAAPGDLSDEAAPSLELDLAGPMPSRPPAAPRPSYAPASYAPPAIGASPLASGSLAPSGLSQAALPVRVAATKPADFSLRFEYDTPIVNGFAFPVAFAFALLLELAEADFLLYSTVCMWTHELGHAAAGWLGGFLSIPLPFFTIYTSDDRNYVVIALVIALWGWLGYRGITRRSAGLVAGAAGVAGLQIWLTFLSVPGRALQWFTYGGLAGELVLSTAMMLAFYVKLPWRWDFWRYVVLFTCAPAFLHSMLRWIHVKLGTADLPRGSAIGDSSEGDVEKLLRTGEFTELTLASTSLALAFGCAVVIVLVYLRMMRKARRIARGEIEAHEETDELLS